MKITSMKAFEKHLEGAEKSQFSPLYLIVSEGAQENRTAIERLVEKISAKEKLSPFGVKKVQPQVLMQELGTPSLFSSKQILIIDVDELSKKEEEAVLKGSPQTTIILSGSSGSSAFYKKVEKEGVVLDFSAEKSWQREKGAEEWVHLFLAKINKKIDRDAALMLVRETRGDTELLTQELNKLLTYIDTAPVIKIQDVHQLVAKGAEASVFELSDALFKKDRPKAVKLMHALLQQGVAYFAILKSIRGQIETDMKVASILKNGGTLAQVSETIPYLKGFILDKHLENIRMMGFSKLKKALTLVDDYDLKGREGQPDYELLADLFVASFP
jgi:DNA polymerase-3 subunit delta